MDVLHSVTERAGARSSRVGIAVLSSALCAALAGCPSTGVKVDSIDYASAQSSAQILLGDPQVYARASLINDRRLETEYLQQLLLNSTIDSTGKSLVNFSPQIIRDLKTVDALSASLSLNLGKAGPAPSTAALQQQIDAEKLQAQLATLQRQVQGIQNAPPPQTIVNAIDTSKTDLTPSTQTPGTVTSPDLSALQSQVKNIQTQLQALATAPTASTAPTAPSLQTDPRDVRAALAEAQLDDVHDRGGNALYRLQFQATVLPPSGTTKQWGAARIRLDPPKLPWGDIVSQYYNWLSYITRQLTLTVADDPTVATRVASQHNYDYDRYISSIGELGYFDVIDMYTTREDLQRLSSKTHYYCFVHSSASKDLMSALEQHGVQPGFDIRVNVVDPSKPKSPPTARTVEYAKLGTYAVPPQLENCPLYPTSEEGAYDLSRPMDSSAVAFVLGEVRQGSSRSSSRLYSLELQTAAVPEAPGQDALRAMKMPSKFCQVLVSDVNAEALCNARGGSFVAAGGSPKDPDYAVKSYSVLPTELAQRLGVTAEASQSLQTALSVAAQVSAASKVGADLGYLKESDARAEALSRQPLVMGFAGTAHELQFDDDKGRGFFGWLFGPQYTVTDAKQLTLAQSVRTYGVNADISIPGWWSYVTLHVSTAWVGSWQRNASPTNPAADRLTDAFVFTEDDAKRVVSVTKHVALPTVDAVYESLTDFVAFKAYGLQNSKIFASYVVPDVLPACASGTITLQIGGANIWRANSIFLGGARAKKVTVLPDMNGVAADFDMSDLWGTVVSTPGAVQALPLMVSAEQGSASPLVVYLVGARATANGATQCTSPLFAPTMLKLLPATVIGTMPSSVCADATDIPIVVDGVNLPDARTLSVESERFTGSVKWRDGDRRITLELTRKKTFAAHPTSVSVVLRDADYSSARVGGLNGAGVVSFDLKVEECQPPKANSATPAAPTAATLKTTSVKLVAAQSISVTVPKGSVLAILEMRADGSDTPLKTSDPQPVDASGAFTFTLDLSGIKAKVGDALSVIVKVSKTKDKPSWTPLSADKKLTIAS